MNFIGREELKAALIHALNHGNADRMLESVIRCIDSYGFSPAEMRSVIFGLKIDTVRLLSVYENEQKDLERHRRENVLAKIEYARQQRHAALVHSGKAAA